MPLTPGGTRLGIYEVTALIGEGGMGLVYRARDTKLNRDVALKVLRDSVASDPDRLARFTREAHTLAVIGASLGLAGALAMGGVLRAQLFGIEPNDPATLAAVCAGLIAVALLACYLPARRAMNISPASILRGG